MSSKRPLDTIRFALGSLDEPRSAVWRLWVHGHDVYFGASLALQAFKVSLHKSRIWRIAWIQTLSQKDKDSDRLIMKWQRPSEHILGWTNCIAVLVSPILPKRPFQSERIADSRIKWVAVTPGKALKFIIEFSKSRVLGNSPMLVGCTCIGKIK